jgi:glycosyltransferase involved in cell wall biosynthesis
VKSLAIVIPETTFSPPQGGGALRVFHLLKELGRHFEVHAITGQSGESLRSAGEPFRLPENIHFHSPAETPRPRDLFDALPDRYASAFRYRWHRRSFAGPANSVFLEMAHLLRSLLESEKIDLIVLEHLESMTLSPLVRRISPGTRLVLDAHNIDHRLVMQGAQGRPDSVAIVREGDRLKEIESNLAREVDAFLACSEADREALTALNHEQLPGFTVPNGVDTDAKVYDRSPGKPSRATLLFCGSLDYAPNRDGILWFHECIWPLILHGCPHFRFRVVGRGNQEDPAYASLHRDPRVDFIGEVDELEPHYRESSACIVPLRKGSGTRLKILEAMAYGSPVVSTGIGAEGIEGNPGNDFLIADNPDAFARAVALVHEDLELHERLRRSARNLVESHYDWGKIGEKLRDDLIALVDDSRQTHLHSPR